MQGRCCQGSYFKLTQSGCVDDKEASFLWFLHGKPVLGLGGPVVRTYNLGFRVQGVGLKVADFRCMLHGLGMNLLQGDFQV